jgi:hypothetical protein
MVKSHDELIMKITEEIAVDHMGEDTEAEDEDNNDGGDAAAAAPPVAVVPHLLLYHLLLPYLRRSSWR